MIYRHSFLFAIAMATVSSAALVACSSDDDNNGGGSGNNGGLLDNEVLLSMLKGDKEKATKLDDNIYIGEDNNFQTDYRHIDFALVPNVNKLGSITGIPKSGWAEKVAVKKEYGYVCCGKNGSSDFYRIYVEDEIRDTDGKIIGYNIRYQHPFYGKDIDIQLPKNELSFTDKGGNEEVKFLDNEPIYFSCKSSADWCKVTPSSSFDKSFLTNAVDVSVDASDTVGVSTATITLTTGYDKKKEITVTRGAAEPRMKLYDNNYSYVTSMDIPIPAGGASKFVYVDSNIPLEDIEVENTASSWCEAKLEKNDGSYSYRGKYVLSITSTSNDTDVKRTGTITLKYRNGEASVKLNVGQEVAYLSLDEGYTIDKPYEVSYSSGSRSVYFRTNIDLNDLKVTNSASWLSSSLQGSNSYGNYVRGYVDLYFYGNYNTNSDREDIVTISSKKGTVLCSFKVKQSGY